MRSEWIMITAGLGSAEYEASAKRLERDFLNLKLPIDVVRLSEKNLFDYCPSFKMYSSERDITNTVGYGYWYWKAEVIHRVLESNKGKVKGVIWLDAGNEIFASLWSRWRLKKMLENAERSGLLAYVLETPEVLYSKSELIHLFSNTEHETSGVQFQANFMFFAGDKGEGIAKEWFGLIHSNPDVLVDSTINQVKGFIGHRHDQSVFSLVLKEHGIEARINPPPTGTNGLKSILKASLFPVWVSRNRTGVTIKPKWLIRIGKVSLFHLRSEFVE